MKKSLIIIVAALAIIVSVNFVLAKANPNGTPFTAIWDKLVELEARIEALETPACVPEAEVCDGVDNDCDGDEDEEGVCASCIPYTPCDDGNNCTINDMCDQTGNCIGGTVMVCNDNNACTLDSCDGVSGCVFEVNTGAACNDGNLCTLNDVCNSSGSCVGTLHPDEGTACDGTDSDKCKNGTYSCAIVGGVECVNENPADILEVCDGQDNDCDGEIDEEGVCD